MTRSLSNKTKITIKDDAITINQADDMWGSARPQTYSSITLTNEECKQLSLAIEDYNNNAMNEW